MFLRPHHYNVNVSQCFKLCLCDPHRLLLLRLPLVLQGHPALAPLPLMASQLLLPLRWHPSLAQLPPVLPRPPLVLQGHPVLL